MLASTIDEFVAALDAQDAEAIKQMFAPNVIAQSPDMNQVIQQLFAFYPGKTEGYDWDRLFSSTHNVQHGVRTSRIETYFTIFSSGVTYYCNVELMYLNEVDDNEIGVQHINFVSEDAFNSRNFKWSVEPGLTVIQDTKATS